MAVIVILGMHRSGTSMVARALARLGAAPGRQALVAPMPDNALGYWEHAGVVAVQHQLLTALGRAPLTAQAVLPMPPGWLDSAESAAAEAELLALLADELDARPDPTRPLLLKDPRTPPLLPLWHRVLARLGEQPRFVLALRHPAAVAASLAARNGLAPALAEALWLRHHLDILRHAKGQLAARLDYDAVLAEPGRPLRRLAAACGLPAPSAALLAELAQPALRHQRAQGAALLPLTEAMYHALRLGRAAPSAAGFEATLELLAATPGWLDQALEFGSRLPLPFPAPGVAGVALQHGNPWCIPAPQGFLLHPNAPGEPSPRLDYTALPLGGRHAWFRARLGTQPEARPMRLEARLHRAGQPLASASLALPPGFDAPVELPLPGSGTGPAELTLELHLAAEARDHFNCGLSLFRPLLEWG